MKAVLFALAALAAFALIIAGSLSSAGPVPEGASTDMKLVILGTGTPNADPDRSGPALAIVAGGLAFIVDAGPGIVRRAAAAARNGEKALDAEKLDTAFLTHLHSDHTLGLPDLIFSPWTLGREKPLTLYGPPGTTAMAQRLEDAYTEDRAIRLDGLEPANMTGWRVNAHEIKKAGKAFQKDGVLVEAIPVNHGSWKYAYDYKFSYAGKTIVISGDTAPSDTLIEAAKGADILAHEVYSSEGFAKRPPEWRRYHKAFHTSATELAAIARATKPKLLILYHQLYWGYSDEDLIREIREAGYDGKVVSARDLDVFNP